MTGDALLTAIHVAKEVNICDADDSEEDGGTTKDSFLAETNKELQELLEMRRAQKNIVVSTSASRKQQGKSKGGKPILILEQDSTGHMYGLSYEDDTAGEAYAAKEVPQLATKYDLAVTGSNLAAAYEYHADTKSILEHLKVFARMTPDAKETVIECLHSVGKLCLMCGDGANDVGALKQADVGVALLSGFGDVNVDKGEDGNKKKNAAKDGSSAVVANTSNLTVLSPQEREAARLSPIWALKAKLRAIGVDLSKYPELTENKEDLIKLYKIKGREVAIKKYEKQQKVEEAKKKNFEAKGKQCELMQEKQQKMALRVNLYLDGVSDDVFSILVVYDCRVNHLSKDSEIQTYTSILFLLWPQKITAYGV
jgi:hypothetical protein